MRISDPREFAPPYTVPSRIQQAQDVAKTDHPTGYHRLPKKVYKQSLWIAQRHMLPLLFGTILVTGVSFGGVAWYLMAQYEAPPSPSLNSSPTTLKIQGLSKE